jgi:hypothetical protein
LYLHTSGISEKHIPLCSGEESEVCAAGISPAAPSAGEPKRQLRSGEANEPHGSERRRAQAATTLFDGKATTVKRERERIKGKDQAVDRCEKGVAVFFRCFHAMILVCAPRVHVIFLRVLHRGEVVANDSFARLLARNAAVKPIPRA